MVKSIEQLLGGRYEYAAVPPHLSENAVSIALPPDDEFRGRITVTSADGQRLRGFGHVTNARIVLAHDRFTGTQLQIDYGIDTHGLLTGDVLDGEIVLSLSSGETVIPVHVDILPEAGAGQRTKIRSLGEFAAYARTDFADAFHLFSEGALVPVIAGEPEEIRELYRAFTSGTVTFQHLEEFLVSAGLKEPLSYTANKTEDRFEHLTEDVQGVLRISKNTWGNVNLTVSVRGGFLSVPQKHFLADDFIGNIIDIPYVISYDALGEGQHRGRIEVRTDTGDLVLHVSASKHSGAQSEERAAVKRAIAGIARDLIEYRLQRIDGTAFMKRCVPRISQIRRTEGDGIRLDLLEAYAYSLVGAKKAVSDILRKWRGHDFGEEAATLEAMYLYLSVSCGLTEMDRNALSDELAGLFAEDEDSLIILLLLARTDSSLASRPGRILSYMSRMYRSGVRSPFLYMEAALLLRGNAQLMNSLTPFARGILLFALRYGIADQDLCLRASLLSENEKTFTPAVYRILTASYEAYPMVDILLSVCRLIMKGNPRRPEFHRWYALAVEEDIRLTRLYEYYMETLPEHYRKILPVKVRRYFTLNNTLGAGRKALLFANIILNRAYDRETYDEYEKSMQQFAREMAAEGNMNEDFAVLYEEFVPTVPTKDMAEAMCRIMFRHAVVVDDPRVREVVVTHRALAREESYPVYHGTAYADLYSKEAVLVFRDERGRRFHSGIRYRIQRLLDYEPYLAPCRAHDVMEAGLAACLCARADSIEENEEYLTEYLYAASSAEFSDEYRKDVSGQLLEYFAAHPDSDSLDLFLSQVNPETAARAGHTLLLEMMIRRGMIRESFAVACRYGYEELEPGALCRMVSRMIALRDFAYDEELSLAAYYAFSRDASDETTIRYLAANFEGRLDDMCAIRAAANRMGVDTRVLDEKILRYSMLCRKKPADSAAILRGYAAAGGSRKIREAYLNFEALSSFYEDTVLDAGIAVSLSRAYDAGIKKNEVCYLALLRRYAESGSLTEEENKRMARLLADAVRAGYLFAFYEKLPTHLRQLYQLDDKLIIEYHGLPSDKALISYRNSSEGEETFREEPMKRMVGGIFARAFVMFGGQVLRYRITVIRGGQEETLPEYSAVMPVGEEAGRSRYRRIVRMMQELRAGSADAFDTTLRKYRLAIHTVETLFPLQARSGAQDDGREVL